MNIKILTIVGVGLIGGSIGLAAKRRGLAERVLGAGRNKASLNRARERGAIDECLIDLAAAVHRADVAVFCTPVDRIADQVLALAPGCKPGTLLTDAGSTKAVIVRALDGRLPEHVAFVGSHPLAGSEKRGPEHADADLFADRLTIITPTASTSAAALARTEEFWRSLGSRVRIMDVDDHDQALALTSHVPHLLASSLAGILPPQLRDLTASGFRDTTRIAAGDPELWTAIFSQNRDAVLKALAALIADLQEMHNFLEARDWESVRDYLIQAKKVRDALGS